MHRRPTRVLAASAATLTALERGEVMMLPPTRVCLEDLAAAGSLAEVGADAVDVPLVLPELTTEDGELVLRTPLPAPGGRGPR